MAGRRRTGTVAAGSIPAPEKEYTKEQLCRSERYREYRDLVDALLDNGKKYTVETVDQMIETYKKGKVV